MDKDQFEEHVLDSEYPSWAIKGAEIYFSQNEPDLDLMTWRFGDEVLVFLTNDPGKREYRVIFNFKKMDMRDSSLESKLIDFFEDAEKLVEQYRKKNMDVKSSLTAQEDQEVEIDGTVVKIEKGEKILVGDE